MAILKINGDTSGSVSLTVPAAAGTNTATVPAQTGTLEMLGVGTAVNSTSGTSIDFTSIPSWVKRITVMFNGVSTSGTSNYIVQLGSTTFTTTGYVSGSGAVGGVAPTTATNGLLINASPAAAEAYYGLMTITNLSGNIWVAAGSVSTTVSAYCKASSGGVTLSGTLDRIRITTANGTDAFDAGSINILYEG